MKNIASIPFRILSFLIDLFISCLVPLTLVLWLSSSFTNLEVLTGRFIVVLSLIFIYLILYPFLVSFLISNYGGTFGKLLTGTRIVSSEEKNLSFLKAFFRNHIRYIVSSIFLWIGFFWVFVDKERRSWHDLMADTYVIVTNKMFFLFGAISLIVFIGLDIFLLNSIANNFRLNSPFLTDFIQTINAESQKNQQINPFSFEVSPPQGWYIQAFKAKDKSGLKDIYISPTKFDFLNLKKISDYPEGFVKIIEVPTSSLFYYPDMKNKNYVNAKEVLDSIVSERTMKSENGIALSTIDYYSYLRLPTKPLIDGAVEVTLPELQNPSASVPVFFYWYVTNGKLYEIQVIYPVDISMRGDFDKVILAILSSFK